MKIVKKVITIFVTIVLLLVLSFNIFNFISIKLLGNDLPTINGYAYLEVISGSMEPKISKGDIVIIDTKISNYKVNDIVTFRDINGSFVTHRIIEINEKDIITKGDANNTIDDSILKDDIVGRYVYQIDGFGALIKSLRSPFVLIMILVVGILLCVFVSTDSKGNAILTEEEKEYMEFLANKNNKTITSKKTTSRNTTKLVKSKTPTKRDDKKVTKTTNNKDSDTKKAKANNKTTNKTVKQTTKSDKSSSKAKTSKNTKPTKVVDNKETTKNVKATAKNKTETKKVEKPTNKTTKTTKSTSNKNTKQSSKSVKTTSKKKNETSKNKPTDKTTKKTTKK